MFTITSTHSKHEFKPKRIHQRHVGPLEPHNNTQSNLNLRYPVTVLIEHQLSPTKASLQPTLGHSLTPTLTLAHAIILAVPIHFDAKPSVGSGRDELER